MPRQPDDPDVVAEVLAAELRADAEPLGEREHLGLQLVVAEPVPDRGPRRRQVVEVVGGGVLRGLQGVLRGRAADDQGEVVRRAGGRAQRADLLLEVGHQPGRAEHRLGLLEEVGLVRRAAALGHEQELVRRLVPRRRVGVELDLRRQVGAGVALLPHGERRHLRVAQVQLGVGVVDPAADGRLVGARRQDVLAALAHDDRGAGVLAHRQHPAGRDVRVLQQVQRHEPVVGRGLRVVEDPPQLREVGRPQEVRDVAHRLEREQPQRLRLDLEERASRRLDGRHALGGDQAVRRLVGAARQQVGVGELGHALRVCRGSATAPRRAAAPAPRPTARPARPPGGRARGPAGAPRARPPRWPAGRRRR